MTVAVALLVIFFIGSAVCAIAAGGIPAFAGTIRQKEVLFALRLSAATASLSTLIVMALALPTAYALTRTSMPFKELSGIIIELTFSIPSAIFTEATLSYLSLGVPVPLASWGTLANEGARVLQLMPYQILFPALLLSLTMLGFNLLGDGLRDALDPKLRR